MTYRWDSTKQRGIPQSIIPQVEELPVANFTRTNRTQNSLATKWLNKSFDQTFSKVWPPAGAGSGLQVIKPEAKTIANTNQYIPDKELSIYDIAEYFSGQDHFVFLDSRLYGKDHPLGRFSFVAVRPFAILKSKANRVWFQQGRGDDLEHPGKNQVFEQEIYGNVFDALEREFSRYVMPQSLNPGEIPFLGGAIGYFGYELGRQIEELPITTRDAMDIPECYIGFYNAVVIYDHIKEKLFVSYFEPHCECSIRSFSQFKEEILAIPPGLYAAKGYTKGWKKLRGSSTMSRLPCDKNHDVMANMWEHFHGDFTRPGYMKAIERIKEYIIAGDVYQADLTQRFETSMTGIPPWELYKRLLDMNPAPYAAYLNFHGVQVVSSSPERFLTVNGQQVKTRPIKGTIQRGRDQAEDERNRDFLFNDEKNRAELAMIVDLLRNDLGRVCRAGSVQAGAFPELETYASVFHLACTVRGELAPGKGLVDLLKATFPGGSITGAPKIRAMEILDELEPVERGIYTGSIGYLGFNGSADLNIVIRTITVAQGKAHIQAGGGIVADSQAGDEYDETILKAWKLFHAFLKENE